MCLGHLTLLERRNGLVHAAVYALPEGFANALDVLTLPLPTPASPYSIRASACAGHLTLLERRNGLVHAAVYALPEGFADALDVLTLPPPTLVELDQPVADPDPSGSAFGADPEDTLWSGEPLKGAAALGGSGNASRCACSCSAATTLFIVRTCNDIACLPSSDLSKLAPSTPHGI